MDVTIRIRVGARHVVRQLAPGGSLREAALDASLDLDAPCGGKGLCGKCRVRLLGGRVSPPDAEERTYLSEAELAAGERLACRARIEGEVEFRIPEAGEAGIVTLAGRAFGAATDAAFGAAAGAAAGVAAPDPPVRRLLLRLDPPSLADQADDETRLLRALAALGFGTGHRLSPAALASLAGLARETRQLSALVSGGELLDLRVADSPGPSLGVGIDIGTTTLVCYLVDLDTGDQLAFASALNAQRSFGADVISRIASASESPEALETLRAAVTGQLAALIAALVAEAALALEDLASIVIAGNTTMLHLLMGVQPAAMARAPFTPVFLAGRRVSAVSLGLVGHSACSATLLPGVSAYVGADIVAGLCAVGMADAEGPELFVDLGTNGELALGGRRGILCCATAAGPAFEGAGIEQGLAGVAGAIDAVWLEEGRLRSSTIGGRPALGICGSGLVDALAVFLDCGLVDATGRIVDAEEARRLPPALAELREGEGPQARLCVDRAAALYLSQADIRAAQLAKAAVAAGIASLCAAAGLESGKIGRLWLAGGFGSFIDLRSAARIGLLPSALRDRAIVAGNAAGAGAVAACLWASRLADCDRLRSLCGYLELSSRRDFNELFVEHMTFPEPD